MLPAKPFYLIRHGQTDANAAKVISGGTEATLTDEGKSVAEALGVLMTYADPRPAIVIHSGRTRTLGTAERLNKILKLPFIVDAGLDEHHYGDWIGLPADPYVDRVVAQGETPPGGESMEVFAARVREKLGAVLEQHPSPPLVVAHGGTFRGFAHLYGRRWHSPNTVLHYFEPVPGDFPWKIWKLSPESGRLRREEVLLI